MSTSNTIRQLGDARNCGAISSLGHFILLKFNEWVDPATGRVSDVSAERLIEAARVDFHFLGSIAVPSARTIQREMIVLENDGWITPKHIQGSQRPYSVLLGASNSPNTNMEHVQSTSKKGEKRDGDVSVTKSPDFDGDKSESTTNKTNGLHESNVQTLTVTKSPDFDGDVSEGGWVGGLAGKSPSHGGQPESFAPPASSPSPSPKTALTGNGAGEGALQDDEGNSNTTGLKTAGKGNLAHLNLARKALGEVTHAAGLGNPSLTAGERRNLAQLIKETPPWVAAPGHTFHFNHDQSDWEYSFLANNPTTVEPWQVVVLHFAFWLETKKESLQKFKKLHHLFATFISQQLEIEFAWEEKVYFVKLTAGHEANPSE